MSVIRQLAREIAERDAKLGLAPPATIEEAVTILAAVVFAAYPDPELEPKPEEVTVRNQLTLDRMKAEPPETEGEALVATRWVSDEQRKALAVDLERGARGLLRLTPEILNEAAQAITGPTKRELDLDALLHGEDLATVLEFADTYGSDHTRGAPEAARQIRAWLGRV